MDENGSKVIEKLYFVPGNGTDISAFATSGNGWYKNEKEIEWTSGTISKYYAKGYFTWGNGDVSVSNASGNVTNVPKSITISNKSTVDGTGKYGLVFNKYAYVTFSFTEKNAIGISNDYSVTIRISESGNNI